LCNRGLHYTVLYYNVVYASVL